MNLCSRQALCVPVNEFNHFLVAMFSMQIHWLPHFPYYVNKKALLSKKMFFISNRYTECLEGQQEIKGLTLRERFFSTSVRVITNLQMCAHSECHLSFGLYWTECGASFSNSPGFNIV